MAFDPAAYGPDVSSVLMLNGERLMPLVQNGPSVPEARPQIAALSAGAATRAGLYLYFGFWSEAHEIAQDINTPEGSYWHAIVHRQEPDAFNSGYWFRQTGVHPIFPTLRESAAALGFECGTRWNPSAFIEFCEQARTHPGSGEEVCALNVQRVEWQLLFDYCAARNI